jgi:ribosomal protein L7/L12
MSSLELQEIALLKGQVSRLETRLEYLYKHLGVTFVEDTRPGDHPDVIAMLRSNNLIGAIKVYRDITGLGLAEAKPAVEEMRSRLGI